MTAPAARTRLPTARRRAQLADEAGRLFRLHGFHQVAMADVAGAVGITAPALYRHFANKQELLVAAVSGALDAVEAAVARADDAPLPEFLDVLAEAAVTHAGLWVLLQRELRHVGPTGRAPLDRRFAAVAHRFAAALVRDDPALAPTDARLLTVAVLAVLASPSVHRREVDPVRQATVLGAAALSAARVRWLPGATDVSPGHEPTGRSEQLLATAVRLFVARGYPAVSLDDIGAELGMAGPSIYHWYATKADLLVAAFTGASRRLTDRHGTDPDLAELVEGYVALGVQEHRFFALYVLEAKNLPPEAGRRVQQALTADVAAWVRAATRARPELPADETTVLVHAARAVVQDVVRLGSWVQRPGTPAALRAVVHAVLATPLAAR